MGKRHINPRVALRAVVIAVGMALLGIGLGMMLARGFPQPPSRAAKPSSIRVPTTTSSPLTPLISDKTIAIDRNLDAAINRALGTIGQVHLVGEQAAQYGPQPSQLPTRTLEVRVRGRMEDAVAVLGKEVEGAGGEILSRTPTAVLIGFRQDGRALATHDVHFVAVPSQGRVAIIFDDAGGSLEDLEPIIALSRPVVVAVLPGRRFSSEVAARARAAGLEVLLHLPLEPEDATKELGPGGITTAMSDEEITRTVLAGLLTVPGAIGVNNHMGSRGTTDERVMRAVLQVVKEHGLLFVDSVTSSRSLAGRLAGEMQVRSTARSVFLDNENEAAYIRRQVQRLITLARRHQTAVAIGHAHRMTAYVLKEMLAEFDRQGVEIVPVSAIVR